MKEIKIRKIIMLELILIVMMILIATSYAYFTITVEGNDKAKEVNVTNANMSLRLKGEQIVGIENMYPGISHSIEFAVENTGNVMAIYNLDIIEIENNLENKEDIVYKIEREGEKVKEEEKVPEKEEVMIRNVKIEEGEEQKYKLTITYKETGKEQNENEGKRFKGRVQINKIEDQALARQIILKNNIKQETPDFSKGEPPQEGENTGSGLYMAEDDDGPTYYFRGKIENNYVKFGRGVTAGNSTEHDLMWRIMRINGDGSVRLASSEVLVHGAHQSDEMGNDRKHAGYTYDNESICDIENPCISDYDESKNEFVTNKKMTNITIKDKLEKWYIDNFGPKDLNKYLTLSNVCSDTSTGNTDENATIWHTNAVNRMNYGPPSFKCPKTKELFGGLYKVKIGMLTSDEVNFAGLTSKSIRANDKNFLYRKEWWQLITVVGFPPKNSSNKMFTVMYAKEGYYGGGNNQNVGIVTRGVISLKNSVLVSGNGTEEDPYVVQEV